MGGECGGTTRQKWSNGRRVGEPLQGCCDGSAGANAGWKAVCCVGGEKATLDRLVHEKGIVLTDEAKARLDALPETFLDIAAAPESFAAQWREAA